MGKAKHSYLNFPVSMIPPIYLEKDIVTPMDNIISYGIALFVRENKTTKKEAGEKLGIHIGSTLEQLMGVYDKYHEVAKVMTSIDKNKAFSLRDAHKSYKDNKDEIMALCGELAVRSIVGVKEYAKCYRSLVLSRMAGFAKVIEESNYPEAIKRLSGDGGKRQWRKLIGSLRFAGCSVYAPDGCHGFYASFRLSPLELAEKVERKRMSGRAGTEYETEYDLSNEELRKRALEKINNRTP